MRVRKIKLGHKPRRLKAHRKLRRRWGHGCPWCAMAEKRGIIDKINKRQKMRATIVQLEEQQFCKLPVGGSSPSGSSIVGENDLSAR